MDDVITKPRTIMVPVTDQRQVALQRRDPDNWWLYSGTKKYSVSTADLFDPAHLDIECNLKMTANQRVLWLRSLCEALRKYGVSIHLTKSQVMA